MSKEIISQLKKIREHNGQINPDHVWVGRAREQILNQISNTVPEEKRQFNMEMVWEAMGILLPNRFVYSVVRPVAVFVLIGAIATSGWIASVGATQNCLPGEICYGVKMATEKTQELVVAVTGSDETATQMHLEFAGRRAEEVKKVAVKNAPDVSKNANVAIKKLEQSIQSAGESLKNMSESQPGKMVEATKEMAQKSEEIKTNLQEATLQNAGVNIVEANKIINDAKVEAITTVLEKQAEGKVTESAQEVKNLVTDHINNVLQDAKDIKIQAVEVVKEAVAVPTTTIISIITSTSTITIPAVISTSSVSTEVKAVVVEATKAVNATNETVKKSLAEAKTLADNNQLKEAIEKVKEATTVNQQSQQVVTEASKAVKDAVAINALNNAVTSTIVLPPTIVVPTTTGMIEQKLEIKKLGN